MLYTTQGINQKRFIEEGYAQKLDFNDAAILSFIYNWSAHPNSEKLMEGNKMYCWIAHQLIVDQMPLAFDPNISKKANKQRAYRLMTKYTELGLLEKHGGSQRLAKSFYHITAKLAGLMMEGAKPSKYEPTSDANDPYIKAEVPLHQGGSTPTSRLKGDYSNKDNSNKETLSLAREGESLDTESKYVTDKMQQGNKEVKLLDMPLLVQNKSKVGLPEMLFLVAYYEAVLADKGIAMSFSNEDLSDAKALLWKLKGTTDATYQEYLKNCKAKGKINPMSPIEYRKLAATKLGQGIGKHEFWGRQEVRSLAKNHNKVYADYKEAAKASKAAKNTTYRKARN